MSGTVRLQMFSHGLLFRSFGIVLWELFSRGRIPYSAWTNKEAADQVKRGYRLEQPTECPLDIYELMLQCWHSGLHSSFDPPPDRLQMLRRDPISRNFRTNCENK